MNRWYVVVTSFGYFYWEYDRHVNYYICQDLTAPALSLYVPPLVSGTVTLHPLVSDLHCDIDEVRISLNGTEIHSSEPNERSVAFQVPWDTTQFDGGPYNLEVQVSDAAGNSYAYVWTTLIDNPSPEEATEQRIETTVQTLGVFAGFLSVIPPIFSDLRRSLSSFLLVLLALVLAFAGLIYPPPQEWTFWDTVRTVASILGIVSFSVMVYDRFTRWRASSQLKPRRKPEYYG